MTRELLSPCSAHLRESLFEFTVIFSLQLKLMHLQLVKSSEFFCSGGKAEQKLSAEQHKQTF